MPTDTILIIDDEESVRNSLAAVMRDEGYDVITASSGQEGIDVLSEAQPSLVMLDIAMPGMDGIETLRRFKEQRPDMPVIMVTGHGTIETAVRTTKVGAYDFLIKPPELAHLALIVKHGLDEHRLRTENESLRNIIERLIIMAPRAEICGDDVPHPVDPSPSSRQPERADLIPPTLKEARAEFEREYIGRKLKEYGGNISRTADAIEVERSNLHRKIKALGIEAAD